MKNTHEKTHYGKQIRIACNCGCNTFEFQETVYLDIEVKPNRRIDFDRSRSHGGFNNTVTCQECGEEFDVREFNTY